MREKRGAGGSYQPPALFLKACSWKFMAIRGSAEMKRFSMVQSCFRNSFWKSICATLAMLIFLAGIASAQGTQSGPVWDQPSVLTAQASSGPSPAVHEDWESITLETSTFKLEPPLLGEIDDVPGKPFIRERWHLTWRPGDIEDIYVVRPRGTTKPAVILYLYSFPQDTDRFKDDAWCTTTTSRGYAAVGFVSALTGYRAEHRPAKEWFVSELQESLAGSVHDVQMILNYLATRGDFDMSRVGMFGQGSGGTIAILASAADPRIAALDVLTPWGDWPDWLQASKLVPDGERTKYLTPEFLASVAALDPVIWLPKAKARSIRIENVRHDGVVPDACQERVESAAPEFAEIDQYGDGRAFYPYAAGGRIFDWISAQLQSGSKPQEVGDKSQLVHFFPAKAESIH
jgi:hypothetical protein